MKSFITPCFLTASLLVAQPAWATDFSDYAVLDLTTLQFRGIDVTVTPQWQSHEATLVEIGSNGLYSGGVRLDSTIQEGHVSVDRTVIASSPGLGTALALSDPSQLSAFVDFHEHGIAQSAVERDSVVHAQQAGFLTVSLQYTVATSAVPSVVIGAPDPAGLGTFSHVHSSIVLSDGGTLTASHGELLAFAGQSGARQTGTLSITRWFTEGQTMDLSLRTEVQRSLIQTERGTVSIPDTLWPMLLGLVGMALWWHRRSEAKNVS